MTDEAGSPAPELCHKLRGFRLLLMHRLFALALGCWIIIVGVGWMPGHRALAVAVDAINASSPTGFAEIVERVKPAVVGIRVKVWEAVSSGDSQQEPPFPPGLPLDRFFRQFGVPVPDDPSPKSETSVASGFFISGDGYIVTNNHVVANGKSFEVTTDDGKIYQAKLIGVDSQTDLALIKVNPPTDLPYVRFAANEPRIGDWVLVVGNPFGLGGTVTAGIVSARGRDIGESPYEDFIQIDAPVNKGNSGGPTFNVKGEVIGVNTAIYSPSGGSVGVAFDIPAEMVKLVVQQLREKGHVTRGWIGVQIQPVTREIADAIGLREASGALVATAEPKGPAARGGIESGDVITSLNGQEVKDPRDLARRIAAMSPDTSVKLGVFHNGKEKTTLLTLGELPITSSAQDRAEAEKMPSEPSVLGLTLVPASAVAGAGEEGVAIVEIDPSSRAAESGLQVGDIVLDISRHPVKTPADVRKFVEEARAQSKRAVLLRIKRRDTTSFVAIPIG
jgi:serine protease Do